jgi:zinc transporter ZupT
MQDLPKRVIVASVIVAVLVALTCLADLFAGVPFSGSSTKLMDILFIVCAAILIYMGWDAYKDLS